jgi:predicted esterase
LTILRSAALSVCAVAATVSRAERTHEIEPEDYFTIQTVQTCATAPDGSSVAVVSLAWDAEDEARRADLWVVDTASRQRTQVASHVAGHCTPQWSADSNELYYLSARPEGDDPLCAGTTQVFRQMLPDGEPQPVTCVAGGVSTFQLSEDGHTLYYTRSVKTLSDDWDRLRQRFSEITFHFGTDEHDELWSVDLETMRAELLITTARAILGFDVANDDARIAIVTAPGGGRTSGEPSSRIEIHDVATGRMDVLSAPRQPQNARPRSSLNLEPLWSPSGHALAWLVAGDRSPTQLMVAEWIDGEAQVRRLERPRDVEVSGSLNWFPASDELCFLGELRARRRVIGIADVRNGTQGAARALTPGHVVVHDFSFPDDGSVVDYVMSDPEHMRDVYRKAPDAPRAGERRLTEMNPHTETWKLPQVTRVQWRAPDGTEIEGILELPHDYDEDDSDESLPLVVLLHGHDTTAHMYEWRFGIHGRTLLPARGYVLLCPNHRGSSGYGDAFMTELIGRENDFEISDVIAGVDALIDTTMVDPDRIAIAGWENGALRVNRLMRTTGRFRAAICTIGLTDESESSELDSSEEAAANMRQLLVKSGHPYQQRASSSGPVSYTRPILVHVGAERIHLSEAVGRMLYRAFKARAGAPVARVDYTTDTRGRSLRDHRRAKFEADLEWLERHVLASERARPDREQ